MNDAKRRIITHHAIQRASERFTALRGLTFDEINNALLECVAVGKRCADARGKISIKSNLENGKPIILKLSSDGKAVVTVCDTSNRHSRFVASKAPDFSKKNPRKYMDKEYQ